MPRLFAAKLNALRAELKGDPPRLRHLYLTSDESSIAPLLGQVDQEFPAVKIGSYPRFEAGDHRLWITVEAAEARGGRTLVHDPWSLREGWVPVRVRPQRLRFKSRGAQPLGVGRPTECYSESAVISHI